ncbi:hypothetical protein GC194_04130 [bacterium]|nr:hypothetical protein [bacterium]
MDYKLLAYFIYLPVTITLTTWVAQRLFSNSKVFMIDIFHGRETIATATNNLFKIGFYLMNLGTAFLIIELNSISTAVRMMESLSTKIGGFTIYLGIMLFLNLFLFFRGKKKSSQNADKRAKSASPDLGGMEAV